MTQPTITPELIDHHRRRAHRSRNVAMRRTIACAVRSLRNLLPKLSRGRADRPTSPEPGHSRRDVAVVVALALAPAIGLGIARFAYALVLPDMRADLGWSYADAGWMNTTNAAGYLLGALIAARAIASVGAHPDRRAGRSPFPVDQGRHRDGDNLRFGLQLLRLAPLVELMLADIGAAGGQSAGPPD